MERKPSILANPKVAVSLVIALMVGGIAAFVGNAVQAPAKGATARELAALQEYLVEPGGGSVVVWRNARALHEAMGLMQRDVEKTHPELFTPLIACAAPSGSPVADLSGVFTVRVEVNGGPAVGCRGVVDAVFLKHHP